MRTNARKGEIRKDGSIKRSIVILWAFCLCAVIAVSGYYFMGARNGVFCVGDMNVPAERVFGGDFTAIDQMGRKVTQNEIITGPTLMYFGYTFCPDICPIDTARNARVADIAQTHGIEITPVFVTVDPERDTPEVLLEYTSYLDENMIALTGSNQQIDHLKKQYGAYGERAESDDPEYYLVDHTAFTYLMTPKGFVAAYDRALTEEQIAENIACHAKKGELG